jgi:hypothetical protein
VRTHSGSEAALKDTVDQLESMDEVRKVVGVMRVEGED